MMRVAALVNKEMDAKECNQIMEVSDAMEQVALSELGSQVV